MPDFPQADWIQATVYNFRNERRLRCSLNFSNDKISAISVNTMATIPTADYLLHL